MGLKARLRVQLHTEVELSQPKTEAKEAYWVIPKKSIQIKNLFPCN